ncbi:primase-helicase family protein [Maribacter dokdonensis]|uniref:primase-helicase family protein n=1 Tax=Maribacter dokdonensis TaxID=320912 RepID=UPI001C082F3F|nr:primase-helicase family protein [Maribacter dokdonensis]MBU2901563.1 helicase [Maribacter dokdonensis]
MSEQYMRIGTEYFKEAYLPLHSGDKTKVLLKWNKGEIITDYGKEYLETISKYDGFCLIPSHTKYQQVIAGFLNQYHAVDHEPLPGELKLTSQFLKHFFGEQYELGLDYLTLLWQRPTQTLPILCLVSTERNTGKSTFLNWLKMVFQSNMTINNNEDFRSRFNADWAAKLIIAVDEVLLDKREDSERIKNLSTAKSYKSESKGKDRVEIPFYGKFILCSNNEENFIYVDNEEIRYWVRKVPKLPKNGDNPDMLDALKKELPHFIHLLTNREISTKKTTRIWFTREQINTAALDKLVKSNKTFIHKELEQILLDEFDLFDKDVLKYSNADLVRKLSENNIRVSSSKVTEAIKLHMGLETTNSSYSKYHVSILPTTQKPWVEETKYKGRHYTFTRESMENNS